MHKLKCLLLILCFSSAQIVFADDTATTSTTAAAATTTKTPDQIMDEQKAACDKNTAQEWSSKLNRCIGKQAAVDTRNDAKACDALTDVAAKEKCHIALAEKNTGLSSDTSKLNQGKTGSSMIMNGVMAAYTIISMIGGFSRGGAKSSCTSKKIFGVTSVAGLASDVYLKMRAKKKVKELEGKYKLDTTTNAHEAQVKALEYLKEEQQTVVAIASLEKKRNLLLMAGYGLAAGWAAYEMAFGKNPACYKKDGDSDSATQEAGANVNSTPASPEQLANNTPLREGVGEGLIKP